MKRRKFLLSSLLMMLGFSAISPVSSRSLFRLGVPSTGSCSATDSLRELRALFSNPEHAKAIGKAYLSSPRVAHCWDTLARGAGLDLRSPHISMKEHIRDRSGKDFARGETVIVNGWVLSKTEASACALLIFV